MRNSEINNCPGDQEASYCTGITMINWEGKSREQWNEYTAFPGSMIPVGTDDPLYQGVADVIFDLDVIYHGARRE